MPARRYSGVSRLTSVTRHYVPKQPLQSIQWASFIGEIDKVFTLPEIGSVHISVQALPRSFYNRSTIEVARELLGCHLVHGVDGVRRVGRIVEVEAYLGEHDLAAHSARGLTARTKVMFGSPGHAYVYFIYGIYYCMNVVTEPEGHASAVLLRALEPVENVAGRTQGPGLLCRAMGIDRRLNGCDLTTGPLFITKPATGAQIRIVKRPRVGIDYARHWSRRLLRFYVAGNSFVSRA